MTSCDNVMHLFILLLTLQQVFEESPHTVLENWYRVCDRLVALVFPFDERGRWIGEIENVAENQATSLSVIKCLAFFAVFPQKHIKGASHWQEKWNVSLSTGRNARAKCQRRRTHAYY